MKRRLRQRKRRAHRRGETSKTPAVLGAAFSLTAAVALRPAAAVRRPSPSRPPRSRPLCHQGRTAEAFLAESADHGWPSFRDSEVVWENVRVLTRGASASGETVTVDGVHLGHNLPDRHGNRYCINLVCVAGPGGEGAEAEAGQQPAGKVDL